MTVSDRLKADIEDFVERTRRDNPLLHRARDGAIRPEVLAAYLTSIRYLVEHTPVFLKLAADRARAGGDLKLAAYFEQKIDEEQGHDQWAADDLAALRDRFGVAVPDAPTPAMRELVGYVARVVDDDPTLYLAYILFAEYFTVLVGPLWIRALEERCGIPPGSLSVIANHVELDRAHVAAGLREIDALVDRPEHVEPLRRTLRGSMDHFEAFCRDLATAA